MQNIAQRSFDHPPAQSDDEDHELEFGEPDGAGGSSKIGRVLATVLGWATLVVLAAYLISARSPIPHAYALGRYAVLAALVTIVISGLRKVQWR